MTCGVKVILRPRSVHHEEYKLLAERLRLARIAAKLTQRDVASRLRKPPSFPHKVERAERELNVIELLDYCEALGLDFVQFTSEIAQAVRDLRGAMPSTPPSTSSPNPPSPPSSTAT